MKVYDAQATCNRVFNLASERGWSDFKLAKIIGVTPQAISKWRRGLGAPSIDMLIILADLFQVSIDDLIGRRDAAISFHLLDGR